MLHVKPRGGTRVASPPDAHATDPDRLDCQHCLAGRGDACAALFKRHERDVARQMYRFTRDRARCAELTHDVFVEAFLSLKHYRPMGVPFAHWLRRIATRVGYRFWKEQAKNKRHLSMENVDVPATPVDAESEASEAASVLHQLLARLPVADRLVLTLFYFEECNVDEIAARTGWPKLAVKMRTHRARQRLKDLIEREKLTDALMLQGSSHGHS